MRKYSEIRDEEFWRTPVIIGPGDGVRSEWGYAPLRRVFELYDGPTFKGVYVYLRDGSRVEIEED